LNEANQIHHHLLRLRLSGVSHVLLHVTSFRPAVIFNAKMMSTCYLNCSGKESLCFEEWSWWTCIYFL